MGPVRHDQIRILFFAFLAMYMPVVGWAQYTSPEDSDPEARRILETIGQKLESSDAYRVSFTLEIEYPGERPITQEGMLIQQDEQYRLVFGDYLIISNADKRWMYIKPDNTVNLYNADSGNDWQSPADFLKLYASEDYVYTILPEHMTADRSVHAIEFKPLDPDSEYSKIRMLVAKNDTQVRSIKAFGKDGSAYTLEVLESAYLPLQPADVFQFDPGKHPGVKIEDLRID